MQKTPAGDGFRLPRDQPDNAERIGPLRLQAGDLIVAGTDGLWDNISRDELFEILENDDVEEAVNLAKAQSLPESAEVLRSNVK